MIKYCQIQDCKNPVSHVTLGHKCEKCGKYGHGEIECNNITSIHNLYRKHRYDRLPSHLHCTFEGCKYFWLHTNSEHYCSNCGENHSRLNCTQFNLNEFDNGNNSEDLSTREPSIKITKIDCPLCRKTNSVNLQEHRIYGLDSKCKVCMTNEIDILLPSCKHAIMCTECVKTIGEETLVESRDYNIVNNIWLGEPEPHFPYNVTGNTAITIEEPYPEPSISHYQDNSIEPDIDNIIY